MPERETELEVFIRQQVARQEAGETIASADQKVVDSAPAQANKASRAERKARLATVLERGSVNPRLEVKLPPHLWGEWIAADPNEIMRMETLGYKIDTEFAPQRALHTKGDRGSLVGDVIFMTTERENYELIQEVYRDQYERLNHPKRQSDGSTTQREEEEVIASIKRQGLVPINVSEQHEARKADIEAVLAAQEPAPT